MPNGLKKWLRVAKLWDGLCALCEEGLAALLRPRRRALRREPMFPRARPQLEALEDRSLLTVVSLSNTSFGFLENIGSVPVTLNLDAPSASTVTVQLDFFDGTASGTSDYFGYSQTVWFSPGTTAQTANVFIASDMLDEEDETFGMALSNPIGATLGTDCYADATIFDDDAAPSVQFSETSPSVMENVPGGQKTITVSLSAPSGKEVTVRYSAANGTASAADYTAASGWLTFAPGDLSKTFTVAIANDSLDEINETVLLSLNSPKNASLGLNANATLTITDDDPEPTVKFDPAAVTVAEGGQAYLSVKLSAASGRDVTVQYASSDGTAAAGSDYSPVCGTLIFAPGETEKYVFVSSSDDYVYEGNETLTVALSAPVGAGLGPQSTATVTLTDNDWPPVFAFSSATYTAGEAAGTVMITVYKSGATGLPASVAYTIANGSAAAGSDYSGTNGTLNFAAAETSKTFNVTIINDSADEDAETVLLGLSNPTGAALANPSSAVLTITDNDTAPTVQFMQSSYTVNEGAPGGVAVITVGLSAASSMTVQVGYASSDSSAIAGSDYTAVYGTLTFAPGATMQSFTVPISNDGVNEGDEALLLTLSNPANAALGIPSTAALTITDNDAAPSVQFSEAFYWEDEDVPGGLATIAVELSAASGMTVSVQYYTTSGTATEGSDYSAASGTLIFAPGQTSKTFGVAILNDTLDEYDETVLLFLSGHTNATMGSPLSAILTIADDDAPPAVSFSGAPYSEAENVAGGLATISVALSAASGKSVTVQYASSNGTAIAGSDYDSATGTLTFAPGQTLKTFGVGITNDSTDEYDETVLLDLSGPANATLASPSSSALTILDDDAPPIVRFSASAYSAREDLDGGVAPLSVILSAVSGKTVTVAFASSDGSALAPGDYAAVSSTLTFAAGDTIENILVPIADDLAVEPDETLTLTLSSPSEATLGSPAAAILTIENDDHPPVAVDDVYTFGNITTLTASEANGLLANDSDPDDDPLTASLVTGTGHGPFHGSVTVYSDGSFTYYPGPTFTGRDFFDYAVSDGAQSDEGHVTLYRVIPGGLLARGSDPAEVLRVPVGEAVADMNMGGLRLSQELDFDLSPGTSVGGRPALVYNSSTVEVRPLFKISLTTDANPGGSPPAPPTSINVWLTWDGVPQAMTTFQTTGHQAGDTYLLAMQAGPVSQSGTYLWKLDVQPVYDSTYAPTLTLTGLRTVVAEADSPYGDGWGIRGIDHLVPVSSGILWVSGEGDQRLFAGNSSSGYSSPFADGGELVESLSGGQTIYVYTARDQTVWRFNTAGLLTSITDTHGLARTYQYDSGGRLWRATSPDGGVTTLDYVTAPAPYNFVTLAHITEPGGRVLSFAHNIGTIPTVMLTSLQDADGNGRVFSYDGAHHLTRDQWAPLDATFSYDAHGFLSGISRGLGVNYAVLPAIAQGFQTSPAVGIGVEDLAVLTDAHGTATNWRLDRYGRPLSRTIDDGDSTTSNPLDLWTRDSAGRVASHTDALNYTTYWYYNSGDLSEIDRPDGSFVLYQHDPVFHHVTTETQSVSSGVNAVTVRTYNGFGDLLSETAAYGTAQAATTDYTWSNGLLQSSEDPLGNVSVFGYDSHRRLEGIDIHDGGLLGDVVFTEDYGYDGNGNLFSTTNVLGITQTGYSGTNRLLSTSVYAPNGTTLVRTNSAGYLAAGHVNFTEDGDGNSTETDFDVVGRAAEERVYDSLDELDWWRGYDYDDVNSLTRTTAGDNTYVDYVWDDWANLVGETAHNANGASVETHAFVHNLNGDVIETIDGDGHYVLFTLDELGRELTETAYDDDDVAAGFTGYTYNKAGGLVDTRDWYGNHTAYGYTLTGLLASEDVYSSANVLLSDTDYYRNLNGYLMSIVDGEDNTTAFTLDALGRAVLTQVFDPLLNLVSKSETHFNTAGFVDWIKDGLGNTTSYVLNALGQATHWEVRTPAPASVLVTQGSAGFTPGGALDWTTDGLNNLLDYSHDGLQQITKVQLLSPTNVLVSETTSQFNDAGNLEWVIDPNGNKTSFVFNGAGKQTHTETRTSTGVLVTDSDEHWTLGGFQDWTEDGEDNRRVVERNGEDQIISEKVFDPNGVLVSQQFAGYDMRGLRTSLTDANGNTTLTVYDGADRPVQEQMLDISSNVIWTKQFGWNRADQLVSETDGNGNVTAFQRDANGRAVGVQVRNANNVVVGPRKGGQEKVSGTVSKCPRIKITILGNGP